jgi:diguanylate cyclase (GGDEF)-like protein
MDSIFQRISGSPNADQWHRYRCSAERFRRLTEAVQALGLTVNSLDSADSAVPSARILDASGVLCVAESSARCPSPFRQSPGDYSLAFTSDRDAASEVGRWLGERLEPATAKEKGAQRSSLLLTLLQDHERQAWLELECVMLRSVQALNQLDLEGEPLFSSLSRLVEELLEPELFEVEMTNPSEFWPGRESGWTWQRASQLEYAMPAILTPRLQRLLHRRERVLYVEDLAAAPDVQLAGSSRGSPFRSAFLLPLLGGAQLLGIIKLLYARTLCPLAGEVEALEVLRRELSLYLDRTRTLVRMQRMAMVDGLTNLFNHRFFRDQLRTEFQRAVRYQKSMALIMIDIDDFKGYNDTYGHLAGDRVLAETACTVRGSVRDIDFVARYGGEEFALILPEVDAQSGLIVAEKIRKAVEAQRFISEDGEMIGSITVSCGVTDNRDAASPDVLIERADRALYWVKRHGRNLVRLASESDHE